MNFGIFRKYQKPLLWATVIFSVLIFATFSGLGDLERLISGEDPDAFGRFTIPTNGEVVAVTASDFGATRVALNRLNPGARGGLEEDDVWRHMMLVREARAAGLTVSDAELADSIQLIVAQVAQNSDGPVSYHGLQLYRRFGFASARQFEEAMRETMLAQKWSTTKLRAASLSTADDVYLRWRTDNELFDFDALVFDDVPLDEIQDPGDEALQTYFDEIPEVSRAARFKSPAENDIAYAWLPFEMELSTLPEAVLAEIAEPDEGQLRNRYFQSLTEFTQEAFSKELTEEETALFTKEVKLQEVARDLTAAVSELTEEERTVERFLEMASEYGFATANPEGLLKPDEIEALDGFVEGASSSLGFTTVGNATAVSPVAGSTGVAVAFIESRVEEAPLSFADAHEPVLEAWKKEQQDAHAKDFREALTERAKALPEVAEVVQSILDAATEAVEQRIADSTEELTDEQKEAMRTEAMDAEEFTIAQRVTQDEHKVWDEVVAEFLDRPGVERKSYDDVSRSYATNPDEADEAGGFDRWLKSNRGLTALGVDGISQRLRHAPSEKSVVVRVSERTFPEKSAMFEDSDGLLAARNAMMVQNRQAVSTTMFEIEQMKADYKLELVEREDGSEG